MQKSVKSVKPQTLCVISLATLLSINSKPMIQRDRCFSFSIYFPIKKNLENNRKKRLIANQVKEKIKRVVNK